MLELLVLISGLVALWNFHKSTKAVAQGAETKTQVWAEEIIADSVVKRAENYKQFKKDIEGLDVVSHEAFMAEMKVD